MRYWHNVDLEYAVRLGRPGRPADLLISNSITIGEAMVLMKLRDEAKRELARRRSWRRWLPWNWMWM